MFTKKRILAWLLCLAMVLTIVGPASVRAQQPEQPAQTQPNNWGEYVIYGEAGETTYVPAGYTYVYEGEDGQFYQQEVAQDAYISTRVLTAEEAEALANLEHGESRMVNVDGQSLLRKEFNAQEAAAYSAAVHAILDGVELKETDNVSVLCEAYTAQTPVRALITFEDAPVIRMESMSVSLGKPLGKAELQASRTIEHQQVSIMAKAEKHLGYEIQVHNQFSLLTNAVAATVNYGDLAKINQMEGIKSAVLMPSYSVPELETQVVDADFVLTPNMQYAAPGMGAENAWDLGYKGEGMSVAILDTGLSFANVSFSIEPSDPNRVAYTKDEIADILATAELNAETLSTDTAIDTVYYSSKVPFGFDYGDGVANFGEDTAWQGHGSHVAGIVAGNLPDAAKEQFQMEHMGIAPEAQLIIMKVFDMMGQGQLDYILAAMEDCLTLGVDCANLSLGSPSGPHYFEGVTEIFDAAYEAGINVVVSAGNEAHSGLNSFWGDNMVKSDSVSTGTIGMPGTFDSVLTVASVENSHIFNHLSNSGGASFFFEDRWGVRGMFYYYELPGVPEGKGFQESLLGQRLAYTDDLEDAEGKLLFVRITDTNADAAIAEAATTGAVGLVLVSMDYRNVTATRFDLPVCTVRAGDYAEAIIRGVPETLVIADAWYDSAVAGEISSFSSWGPTEGLTLKPEITGIGGNVFSAHMMDQFAVMSGTSMASPTVAASAALLRQYLRENELVAEEDLPYVVNCLLMSTATPIYDEDHGTYYFVRRQGAGLANIGAAMASGAYITVEGTNKAKLELGDDPEKVGIYEMTFNVVNFDDVDKSYTLDVTALGQKADGGQIKRGEVTYLTYDYAQELDCEVSSTLEGNTVTVPAGATAEITVTLELTQRQRDYYNERFPAGAYVEGFIQLLSDETPSLVVPFLGFYGNFEDGPILEPMGMETTLSGANSYTTADQFTNALWSYTTAEIKDSYDRINVRAWLGDSASPAFEKIAWADYNYHGNNTTYGDRYTPYWYEHAGISPNGDRSYDTAFVAFALRRNADNIHYTIRNRDTGEVLFEADTGFMPKTFNKEYFAGGELWGELGNYLNVNNTWIDIEADITPEGQSAATERISYSLYCDTEAPISAASYQISYEPDDWEPDYFYHVFTSNYEEQWFLDYEMDVTLQTNPEGLVSGFASMLTYEPNAEPARGQGGASKMMTSFYSNFTRIHVARDYAGNVFAVRIDGDAFADNYMSLAAERTTIQIGETLTISDVAVNNFTTILDWAVSNPSVVELVDSTDHSVTIRGLSKGKADVIGSLGSFAKALEITVTDPAFDALRTKFVDVPDHWAEEDILEAVYRGLFEGVDETHFAPNANITRGQLVTVLHRMEGEPEATETAAFTDLKAGAYYEKAVHWAVENGIVKGITGDTFQPDAPVTREQFATFLYRYAEYKGLDVSVRADLSGYTDGDTVSEYAADAMSWAVANGLIKGVTDTTLSPKTTATRAQAATILVRYLTK